MTGLAGWRVLVPRPSSGGPGAAVALAAAGAEAVLVPLVETSPVEDPTGLDGTLLALAAGWYSWLAVTSGVAVHALATRTDEAHGTDLATLLRAGNARVAAVGPGTARALREVGVEADLVPTDPSTAEHLVQVWPVLDRERPRVLFPRGDLAAGTLAAGLRARGWGVDDPIAYRTVPFTSVPDELRDDWRAGRIDAVLLTSASTARALADLLGPPPAGVLVASIGPTTTQAAREAGLVVHARADRQTLTALVDALAAAAEKATAATPTHPTPPHPQEQ